MAAYYAITDRVYGLDVGFQQVLLVQSFWNFHYIVKKHQSFKIIEEKQNDIFSQKSSLL